MKIIITTDEDLKKIIKEALTEVLLDQKKGLGEKLFTINQVAKMLGKAHTTINKKVKNGIIKSTNDGLIPESAVEEYLNNK